MDDELTLSQAETRAAFEARALVYSTVYDELADELGEERATEIMRRAIHRRGLEHSAKYRPAAHARDLEEVARVFVEGSPCEGALFTPGVEEIGEDIVVLRMESCPLAEAWAGEGRTPDEIDHLCWIAAAIDEGTFEGAGLELAFLERIGAGSCRCLLELRTRD